ncbi:MAG: hypothetical protein KGM98_10995, partial [Bacteroidota bacterium]|nr:hypothetical protein [Bacteroidota bacterium]
MPLHFLRFWNQRLVSLSRMYCIIFLSWFLGGPLLGYSQVKPSEETQNSVTDSLPGLDSHSYLMPYNRIIDGLGTAIEFGTPHKENHSLDATLLPDHRTVAVEDRYGVAFIDWKNNRLISRFAYQNFPTGEGLMSVYSGIKSIEIQGKTHIFWSASDNRNSYVLEAVWTGDTASVINVYPFYAMSPAPLALANDLWVRKEGAGYYMY